MGKIIRHEFLGSRLLVTLLCLTGIGIPLAILHVLEALVTVEEDLEEPSKFLEMHRGKHSGGAFR